MPEAAWLSPAWLGALVLLGGCSPTFMTPPPSGGAAGVARPNVDCTTSYAWPVVDTVLAAYQLGGVAYAATLDDSRYDGYPISRQADMAIGASLGALFVASATYGYIAASRCHRIRQGPPGGGYVPGISEAAPGPRTARLHSEPGGSEMVRRPDPKGAVWKR
jgi:hypothetical protein